jgi:hypothetical protein
MDDGFADFTEPGNDRRPELDGRELLIVGWQLRQRGNGREMARVWALAQTETGDVEKVKFYDAGQGNIVHPGISTVLRDAEDNGNVGDLRVRFGMERYPFFDDDGVEQTGTRYWIEDIEPEVESARINAADDKPDF